MQIPFLNILTNAKKLLYKRYIKGNTNKTWSIKISTIKECLEKEKNFGASNKADIFSQTIQTQDGKENLLKVINGK